MFSGKENSPPKSVTISSHMGKEELLSYFDDNGINYENTDHPEVSFFVIIAFATA